MTMAPTKEDLLALAERCEKAGRAAYVLDEQVFAAVHGWTHSLGPAAAGEYRDIGRPAYTASLDAAMTLVPEGHTIQLSDWDHEILRARGPWQAIVLPLGARGSMKDFTFTNRCEHAATPALALTAAALRARAQEVR